MSVEVMAWNVLDAFSDENRARGVLQVVQAHRPGVMVFAEAWREDKPDILDDVLEAFDSYGYTTVHGLYEDNDDRQDRHGLLGIAKSDIVADKKPQVVSLGSRNALHLPLVYRHTDTETPIDFYGVHLDDRAEKRRLAQAEKLVSMAALSKQVIIAGDLNAMHRSDPRARMLRAVRPITQNMPSIEPRPDFKPPLIKRIGSLASRLTEMASGTTLQALEAAGFTDADTEQQPTKGPFNLDHIYVKGLFAYAPLVREKSPLSDHRSVSTYVRM